MSQASLTISIDTAVVGDILDTSVLSSYWVSLSRDTWADSKQNSDSISWVWYSLSPWQTGAQRVVNLSDFHGKIISYIYFWSTWTVFPTATYNTDTCLKVKPWTSYYPVTVKEWPMQLIFPKACVLRDILECLSSIYALSLDYKNTPKTACLDCKNTCPHGNVFQSDNQHMPRWCYTACCWIERKC